MALIQAASLEGRAAVGRRSGRRARRVRVLGGKRHVLPPRCAACDGYDIHAGVAVGAQDRSGLERLLRYIHRPPLAKGRLELRDDGTYVVHFKRKWSDGTKAVVLNRTELLERLASIVPPPRKNLVTTHGVFGARSSWRSQVVPGKQPGDASPHPHGARLTNHTGLVPKSPSRWPARSLLLWRVFGVEGWACPNCGDRMTLRAVLLAAGLEDRVSLPPASRSFQH